MGLRGRPPAALPRSRQGRPRRGPPRGLVVGGAGGPRPARDGGQARHDRGARRARLVVRRGEGAAGTAAAAAARAGRRRALAAATAARPLRPAHSDLPAHLGLRGGGRGGRRAGDGLSALALPVGGPGAGRARRGAGHLVDAHPHRTSRARLARGGSRGGAVRAGLERAVDVERPPSLVAAAGLGRLRGRHRAARARRRHPRAPLHPDRQARRDQARLRAWRRGADLRRPLPGPPLRVRQGETVEVRLRSLLPDRGVTLHWHGYHVPNGEDGVPGLTQNAVREGGEFVYRFRADQPGSYWYHTHETPNRALQAGLFGMFTVDPVTPEGFDEPVALHTFGGALTVALADAPPADGLATRTLSPARRCVCGWPTPTTPRTRWASAACRTGSRRWTACP
ncbi:multicopper oxidase domain-containing protein [Nonomuraea recticatena]|uniref:multicopper oxidase domain-containing protein n=1 Tax=Nonomuraea recticatena TaxID=46178 RepID=UPI00360FF4E8